MKLFSLALALCLFTGCTTPHHSPNFSKQPIDYTWFKKQFALVQQLNKEAQKANLITQEFVRKKGVGPFQRAEDQKMFEGLNQSTTDTRERLMGAVREYNARAQAEINVLFGRENLPLNINLTYTATMVPVPENPPPPRSLGTNKL